MHASTKTIPLEYYSAVSAGPATVPEVQNTPGEGGLTSAWSLSSPPAGLARARRSQQQAGSCTKESQE